MRVLMWLVAVATLGAVGVVVLGPMLPTDTFLHDWAVSFRRALDAWWGFPLGLPGGPGR